VGWFDAAHEHSWGRFRDMAKQRPDLGCAFVAVLLERWTATAQIGNPFGLAGHEHGLPAEFMHDLEKVPAELASKVLPPIVAAVQRTQITYDSGEVDDQMWGFAFIRHEHDFKGALFGALQRALGRLAIEKPQILEELVAPYESLPHRTMAVFLLSAWSENAVRFADKAVDYLLQNPHRLALGYSSWSGGDGRNAIARGVIRMIAPHCSEANYRRLEEAVLAFEPPEERTRKGPRGYRQLLLLESFPRARMSTRAVGRLEHLLDTFPGTDFSAPRATEVISVPSPISPKAMEHMTDEQWLSAMRKYSPERPRTPENWSKGDMHTLCSELRCEAQANKQRFAALALRMPEDIADAYLSAILDGIAETHGALPEERKSRMVAPDQLNTEAILAVICRLHNFPGRPCGRVICSAFSRLAARPWSDEALGILTCYAANDPDPDKEWWQTPASGGSPYYGGSPESAGLNSVRGGAAHAIAQLLFEDKDRWPKLEATVQTLIKDHILAVRSMAVECLLALLNSNRDEAVRLFLSMVNGAEAILGSRSVDQFLHHAAYSHYGQLRATLVAMLISTDEDARATAARQIAVTAFHNENAKQDLETALAGDEICRAAATHVFAHNLGYEEVRALCRLHLLPLFNDESKKVRETAEVCFRSLSSEQLSEERDLIYSFIQSAAFRDGFNQLSIALEHSSVSLPDVVCAIPETLMAQHLAETPNEPIEQRHAVYQLPELVLRVYDQAGDAAAKTRCLNVIDSLLELGFGSLESELQKVER